MDEQKREELRAEFEKFADTQNWIVKRDRANAWLGFLAGRAAQPAPESVVWLPKEALGWRFETHPSTYRDDPKREPIFIAPQPAAPAISPCVVPREWDNLLTAAKNVLAWTEANHRPPIRDVIETGRGANVRLHALADLHVAVELLATGPQAPTTVEVQRDAERYRAIRSGRGYSVEMKGVTSVHAHRGEVDFGEALDKATDAMVAATLAKEKAK